MYANPPYFQPQAVDDFFTRPLGDGSSTHTALPPPPAASATAAYANATAAAAEPVSLPGAATVARLPSFVDTLVRLWPAWKCPRPPCGVAYPGSPSPSAAPCRQVRFWPAWKCNLQTTLPHFQAHQPNPVLIPPYCTPRCAFGPPGNASRSAAKLHIQAHQPLPPCLNHRARCRTCPLTPATSLPAAQVRCTYYG